MNSLEFVGIPLISVDFLWISWSSSEFLGFHLISFDFFWFPLVSIDFHGFPLISIEPSACNLQPQAFSLHSARPLKVCPLVRQFPAWNLDFDDAVHRNFWFSRKSEHSLAWEGGRRLRRLSILAFDLILHEIRSEARLDEGGGGAGGDSRFHDSYE